MISAGRSVAPPATGVVLPLLPGSGNTISINAGTLAAATVSGNIISQGGGPSPSLEGDAPVFLPLGKSTSAGDGASQAPPPPHLAANSPHRIPASPSWIVPPIVRAGDEGAHETFAMAATAAIAEAGLLTEVAKSGPYPRVSGEERFGFPTASGFRQFVKFILFSFNDVRTLDEARSFFTYSPLGPLVFGAARAIGRHRLRGLSGPADLLEIGAGQRFVPAGLHAVFGEQVRISESSPVYASTRGGIDVELPAASASSASLPENAFELSYSIFGSIYSSNQLAILRKVVSSLKVGGEAYLMWKSSFTNSHMAALARSYPNLFTAGGLDLSVIDMFDLDISIRDKKGENVFIVWARKRAENVDVSGLFAKATRTKGPSGDGTRTIRLSLDGPSFSARDWAAPSVVEPVVDGMVASFLDAADLPASEAYFYRIGKRLPAGTGEEQARRLLVGATMRELPGESLAMHLPLSSATMAYLHPVLEVAGSGVSVPRLTQTIQTAIYRGKLAR